MAQQENQNQSNQGSKSAPSSRHDQEGNQKKSDASQRNSAIEKIKQSEFSSGKGSSSATQQK